MLTLTADHARRFLVRRHLLAPPRALPPTRASVLSVVERLGSLQFDPLEAPGARNHDLVLHARIADHRRALCDELLYPERGERWLFEAYNKSLNLLPTSELPWHRFAWKRSASRGAGEILAKHAKLAKRLLARFEREGALSPNDFEATEERKLVAGYWGVPTSLTRLVLDALFLTGRLGIARRDGNRRTYDLIERLFDRELLARRVSDEESIRHRLMSRHRAVGLMGARSETELILGIGTAAERKRHLSALVNNGDLLEAHVDGLRGVRHVVANELSLVDLTKRTTIQPHVAFLAPLDPLMWDRALVRDLFGFDYKWEVYTPLAQRRHGYYVLPLLFGERLVGRIEPRFDRARGRLHVAGVWLERGFDADEPGFGPAMSEALRAYASFVNAKTTTFGRGKLCRRIAVMVSAS